MNLFLDFESKSYLNLKEVGSYNYWQHSSTKPLMLAWAFEDNEVQLWLPYKDSLPKDLENGLRSPKVTKLSWNCTFERNGFKFNRDIDIPWAEWCDIMVRARYLSLPGALEDAGKILGLPEDEAKIKDGRRLKKLFTEPYTMGGDETLFGTTQPDFHDWDSHPQDWAMFEEYCKRDLTAARTLYKIMKNLPLPEIEQRAWILDQKINERGLPVNKTMMDNGLALAQKSKDELLAEIKKLTGLENPNSNPQMLKWVSEHGYPHLSIGKEFVEAALKDSSLDKVGKEVLTLRKQASKTSYKKLEALQKAVSPDGRLRDAFLFMGGARTGRWSGKLVQPQNMPRPIKEVKKKYERAIELILANNYDTIKKEFPSVIGTVTSCLRSMFWASEGHELNVCDLSAIETRVGGWLAGCKSIVRGFREVKDFDPYIQFATILWPVKYEELYAAYKNGDVDADDKRQISKPPVLAGIYGIGPGAKKRSDGSYEVFYTTDEAGNTVRQGILAYADKMGINLTPKQAVDSIRALREGWVEIPALWKKLETAALEVLKNGGRQKVSFVSFDRKKRTDGSVILRMHLPSGRCLHYINAKIVSRSLTNRDGEPYEKPSIQYDGIGHGVGAIDKHMKWSAVMTYGGKLMENAVQSIAREVLLHGMFLADAADAEICGHFHDEIMCEKEIDNPFAFGLNELRWCMSQTPSWAPGLPLGAEGYMAKFYKKG